MYGLLSWPAVVHGGWAGTNLCLQLLSKHLRFDSMENLFFLLTESVNGWNSIGFENITMSSVPTRLKSIIQTISQHNSILIDFEHIPIRSARTNLKRIIKTTSHRDCMVMDLKYISMSSVRFRLKSIIKQLHRIIEF